MGHEEIRAALRATATEFVRREVTPHLQDWEDAGTIPRELHRAAARQGLLGDGVAASTRFDPQAKGLGEWVRSRMVHVQDGLL